MQNAKIVLTMINAPSEPTFKITSSLERFKTIIHLPTDIVKGNIIRLKKENMKRWIISELEKIYGIKHNNGNEEIVVTAKNEMLPPLEKIRVLEELARLLIVNNNIFSLTSFNLTSSKKMHGTKVYLTMLHSPTQPTIAITSSLERFKTTIHLPKEANIARATHNWLLNEKLVAMCGISCTTNNQEIIITTDNDLTIEKELKVLENIYNSLVIKNHIFSLTSFSFESHNGNGGSK